MTQLRVIESPAALFYERVRTYPKRRAKSMRHWARMDKKYLKRYGHRRIPTAYMMDTSPGEQVLVVHPSLATQYREAIDRVFVPAGLGDTCI